MRYQPIPEIPEGTLFNSISDYISRRLAPALAGAGLDLAPAELEKVAGRVVAWDYGGVTEHPAADLEHCALMVTALWDVDWSPWEVTPATHDITVTHSSTDFPAAGSVVKCTPLPVVGSSLVEIAIRAAEYMNARADLPGAAFIIEVPEGFGDPADLTGYDSGAQSYGFLRISGKLKRPNYPRRHPRLS